MRALATVDWLYTIVKANSVDDLTLILEMICDQAGFHWFFFAKFDQRLDKLLSATILSNWPSDYLERYANLKYYRQSAVVEKAARHEEPFSLKTVFFNPFVTPDGRAVLDEASEVGLTQGLALPVWEGSSMVALATLIHGDDRMPNEDGFALQTLMAGIYRRMNKLTIPNAVVKLTEREREVLSWSAAGKTAKETAIILGLSPRTVEDHMRRIAERLGTVNQAHSVAEAIRRGLLND
jgi:DNA-binding CsgD family transcriptional regulator